MRIKIIVGLPGSGKTTLAKELLQDDDVLLDDLYILARNDKIAPLEYLNKKLIENFEISSENNFKIFSKRKEPALGNFKNSFIDELTPNFKNSLTRLVHEQACMIITDPVLCIEKNMLLLIKFLKDKNIDAEFYLFDKNKEACLNNIHAREDEKLKLFITSVNNLSRDYDVEKIVNICKENQFSVIMVDCYQKEIQKRKKEIKK